MAAALGYHSLNRVTSGQLGLYTTITAPAPAVSASSLAMAYDALGNLCQRSVNGSALYMHYLNSAGCNGAAARQHSAGTPGYASPHALTRVSASVGGSVYTTYGYDAHGNTRSARVNDGERLVLEAVAVHALLLQRPDQPFDHAVPLRAVRRDELLLQAVAPLRINAP